jgi:hypothetical protein
LFSFIDFNLLFCNVLYILLLFVTFLLLHIIFTFINI